MNGKGDSPRNCFSKQYRDNYDHIFRVDERNTTKRCPAILCKSFKKCPMAKDLGVNDNPDEYDEDYHQKECYAPR